MNNKEKVIKALKENENLNTIEGLSQEEVANILESFYAQGKITVTGGLELKDKILRSGVGAKVTTIINQGIVWVD